MTIHPIAPQTFDELTALGTRHLEAAKNYFEQARAILRPGVDRMPVAPYLSLLSAPGDKRNGRL